MTSTVSPLPPSSLPPSLLFSFFSFFLSFIPHKISNGAHDDDARRRLPDYPPHPTQPNPRVFLSFFISFFSFVFHLFIFAYSIGALHCPALPCRCKRARARTLPPSNQLFFFLFSFFFFHFSPHFHRFFFSYCTFRPFIASRRVSVQMFNNLN